MIINSIRKLRCSVRASLYNHNRHFQNSSIHDSNADMAPRKGRHHHTDSMTGSESAAPAQSESAQLNLSVLRKYDPELVEIIHVAPYAVVYVFSPEAQAGHWEKNGIEGSLFICRLCENFESSERYKVILLNRRGLDNFNFELRNEDQVEFTEELIIFQDDSYGDVTIHGLWIFSEPEPSSTAHQPKAVTDTLKYCAERVRMGKEERARALEQAAGAESEDRQVHPHVPGRQLSLSEIFGQQRQQDDAWSVRNHSPLNDFPSPPVYHQAPTSNPIFSQTPSNALSQTPSNAYNGNPLLAAFTQQTSPRPQPQPAGNPLGAQQQHLLGLFSKAKLDQPSGL